MQVSGYDEYTAYAKTPSIQVGVGAAVKRPMGPPSSEKTPTIFSYVVDCAMFSTVCTKYELLKLLDLDFFCSGQNCRIEKTIWRYWTFYGKP